MSDLELCFMPATEIALRIRRRELSPVEVVRNALARLDDTEPKLNAFVHRDDSGALAAAKDTERLAGGSEEASPLLGVPVSVKDLIDVAGMPCRHGSLALAGNTPSHDAPSVARLRAAGAIIIGKTATSEFGLRGYTESLVHGVTRSPWDTSRTPGGSSGGAAASVAAGVTPIALGTDGGGSIRSPSALTGLIGIKPQFGRVPIFPPSATPNLAHVGPVARNSADAALLLSIISGPDQRDWTSLQQPVGDIAKNTEGLRIAFSPTLGYAKVAAEVAECVNDAVRKLSTEFSQVEEVAFVVKMRDQFLAGSSWLASAPVSTNLAQQTVSWTRQR